MNKVLKIKKREKVLESIVKDSSLAFKSVDEGLNLLSFSIGIKALGLSNRDLQPKKLSNYIRAGYLQIQLICSVILCQIKGYSGISRDDLYDSVCEVFPATTYANFRKILRIGVDSDIFTRSRSQEDSRRTLYSLSDEMIEPIGLYFKGIVNDFGNLYAQVMGSRLTENEIIQLMERLDGQWLNEARPLKKKKRLNK